MSLKINGVGKPLLNFVYSVGTTNNDSVFLTIKYSCVNIYGATINKTRVYEFRADMRHPNLNEIARQVDSFMMISKTKRVTIKEYQVRAYVDIKGSRKQEQYTGWSI